MATIITNTDQSTVISNLDTYTYTVTVADMYTVSLWLELMPPSGCVITMKQNSTTKIITSVPSATGREKKPRVVMNCAVNDVISVIITSSVATDADLNAVKSILRITRGVYS